MKKLLFIGFVALLLVSMTTVVGATPWDGVADDSTPSQAIWVDPKNTTVLNIGDEFTVDILVNITSPTLPGGGTGMYGFQCKLYWNSTLLEVVEIQTHADNVPAGDLLPGWTSVYVAKNATWVAPNGLANHTYAVSATGGVAFTGVASLCTYKFKVLWQPGELEPDYQGLLDIDASYTLLIDDTATPIDHTEVDGEYWLRAAAIPPTIDVPSRTPSGDVQPNQNVTVSVNVTDAESGVKNVTLSYTTNNGTSWTDTEMILNATSGLYEATILGQLAWTWVKFKIIAYDNAGNNATRDGTAPSCVYQVVPEFPAALIIPLFMIATIVAVILGKTARSRKRSNLFVGK